MVRLRPVVRGANELRIGISQPNRRNWYQFAQDNLVKGAASQAVTKYEPDVWLDEAAGLDGIGLLP